MDDREELILSEIENINIGEDVRSLMIKREFLIEFKKMLNAYPWTYCLKWLRENRSKISGNNILSVKNRYLYSQTYVKMLNLDKARGAA